MQYTLAKRKQIVISFFNFFLPKCPISFIAYNFDRTKKVILKISVNFDRQLKWTLCNLLSSVARQNCSLMSLPLLLSAIKYLPGENCRSKKVFMQKLRRGQTKIRAQAELLWHLKAKPKQPVYAKSASVLALRLQDTNCSQQLKRLPLKQKNLKPKLLFLRKIFHFLRSDSCQNRAQRGFGSPDRRKWKISQGKSTG